jgi:hypothetical protein
MARRRTDLETLPPRTVPAMQPRGDRRRYYPWSEWFDGAIWEVRQGEDYLHPEDERFRAIARKEAKNRGLRLEIRTVTPGVLLMQITGRTTP